MENEEVERLIREGLPGCEVTVTGDGRHFEAVSEQFAGKPPLQCHRLVLATVKTQIDSDELHALSITTKTP